MASDRFNNAIQVVLGHEGGYVNDPSDTGGETKWGVSKRSYPNLDVKNLTREQAIVIYKRDWWDRYGYEGLPEGIGGKVFDMAVNMGPKTATIILQNALRELGYKLIVDGIMGRATIAASGTSNKEHLLDKLRLLSVKKYVEIVKDDANKAKFLMGWLTRALA